MSGIRDYFATGRRTRKRGPTLDDLIGRSKYLADTLSLDELLIVAESEADAPAITPSSFDTPEFEAAVAKANLLIDEAAEFEGVVAKARRLVRLAAEVERKREAYDAHVAARGITTRGAQPRA